MPRTKHPTTRHSKLRTQNSELINAHLASTVAFVSSEEVTMSGHSRSNPFIPFLEVASRCRTPFLMEESRSASQLARAATIYDTHYFALHLYQRLPLLSDLFQPVLYDYISLAVASMHNLPPNPSLGPLWSSISNGPLLTRVSVSGK